MASLKDLGNISGLIVLTIEATLSRDIETGTEYGTQPTNHRTTRDITCWTGNMGMAYMIGGTDTHIKVILSKINGLDRDSYIFKIN